MYMHIFDDDYSQFSCGEQMVLSDVYIYVYSIDNCTFVYHDTQSDFKDIVKNIKRDCNVVAKDLFGKLLRQNSVLVTHVFYANVPALKIQFQF